MTQMNTGTDIQLWTPDQHALLGQLADMVVPRGHGMPSATDVDVHVQGVKKVAAMRPDLIPPVSHILYGCAASMPAALSELIADYPDQFPAFAELVAGAFYLDPRVGELLGYRARRAIPVGDLTRQDAELADLVIPVKTRGNVWRETPS
jgi:hypothetical protein